MQLTTSIYRLELISDKAFSNWLIALIICSKIGPPDVKVQKYLANFQNTILTSPTQWIYHV